MNFELLDAVRLDAYRLTQGTQEPSLKLALWASALSTMQELGKNGVMTRLLAPYVESSLPAQEELFDLLRKAKGVLFGSHLKSLYCIEYLDKSGGLDQFKYFPTGYVAQSLWRDRLVKSVLGISYKTASFTALLYSPLHSELVPVDRHVLRRLGYEYSSSPQRKKDYLKIELEVMQEREDAGMVEVPLSLWHWYKWEEQRQNTGASKSNVCESHNSLNCREY